MDVHAFMKAVLAQDAEGMANFFAPGAIVRWHCSNEMFTVDEYIRANCEYPGEWDGAVERVLEAGAVIAAATRVYTCDHTQQFHVATFFTLDANGRIAAMDEYWGDDGPAPQWRQALGMGRPIR